MLHRRYQKNRNTGKARLQTPLSAEGQQLSKRSLIHTGEIAGHHQTGPPRSFQRGIYGTQRPPFGKQIFHNAIAVFPGFFAYAPPLFVFLSAERTTAHEHAAGIPQKAFQNPGSPQNETLTFFSRPFRRTGDTQSGFIPPETAAPASRQNNAGKIPHCSLLPGRNERDGGRAAPSAG